MDDPRTSTTLTMLLDAAASAPAVTDDPEGAASAGAPA